MQSPSKMEGLILARLAALVFVVGLVLAAFGFYGLSRTSMTVTVTNTYTVTNYSNQNSTSAMPYYMVCIATLVYGGTISGQTMTFVPFYTASTTFVLVTTSSASVEYVLTVPNGTT